MQLCLHCTVQRPLFHVSVYVVFVKRVRGLFPHLTGLHVMGREGKRAEATCQRGREETQLLHQESADCVNCKFSNLRELVLLLTFTSNLIYSHFFYLKLSKHVLYFTVHFSLFLKTSNFVNYTVKWCLLIFWVKKMSVFQKQPSLTLPQWGVLILKVSPKLQKEQQSVYRVQL